MRDRLVALAALLLTVTACGIPNQRLQTATSGTVGCPPEEIEISHRDESVPGIPQAWQASCRGRTFQCSGQGNVITCTPLLPPVTSPLAATPEPPPGAAPPAGAPSATEIASPACAEAAAYDKRVAAATSPAKEQLERIAKRKHAECALGQATGAKSD